MHWSARFVPWILLLLAACDNKRVGDAPHAEAPSPSGVAAPDATPPPAPDAGARPPSPVTMPERPVPKPQTMVSSSMSIEVQQKAIGYMVAMRAPHPDDAAADPAYAGDLAMKLKPIALSMDTGASKERMNRVDVVANGRQIDILMATGCDDRTAQRAVVHRAGRSFFDLASHGVLVVRCNDSRIQCLQSTRNPDDVLCTTAPRHK